MRLLGLLLVITAANPSPEPGAVLRGWDAHRAAAFESGDVTALQRLYVDGSAAAEGDVGLLQDYRTRGLDLWMGTQVFALRPVDVGPSRLVLRVTDRVVAVVGDGVQCRRLPVGTPATRTLVMKRVDGTWLMESVSSARRAAPR